MSGTSYDNSVVYCCRLDCLTFRSNLCMKTWVRRQLRCLFSIQLLCSESDFMRYCFWLFKCLQRQSPAFAAMRGVLFSHASLATLFDLPSSSTRYLPPKSSNFAFTRPMSVTLD